MKKPMTNTSKFIIKKWHPFKSVSFLILLTSSLLLPLTGWAQDILPDTIQEVSWVEHSEQYDMGGGGYGFSQGLSTAIDKEGNVIETGAFLGPKRFGKGGDAITLEPYAGSNAYDMFVVKYDERGKLLWAKSANTIVEGGNPRSISGQGVAVDAEGNIFITGAFGIPHDTLKVTVSKAHFGKDVNDQDVIMNGAAMTKEMDAFVVKYDSEGNPVWARGVAGTKGKHVGRSVATDTTGNVYFTGIYHGNSNLIESGTTTLGTELPGDCDFCAECGCGGPEDTRIFLIKYLPDGNMAWEQHYGRIGDFENNLVTLNDNVYDITVDYEGNVLITGHFQYQIDFGNEFEFNAGLGDLEVNGPAEQFGTSDRDMFILKVAPADGSTIWATTAGGIDVDDFSMIDGEGITTDSLGNVLIVGNYESAVLFGSGTPAETEIEKRFSTLWPAMFIAKYSKTGEFEWVRTGGSSVAAFGQSVAVDKVNNIYVTGGFEGGSFYLDQYSAYTGNPNNDHLVLPPQQANNDEGEIYVAKYSPIGDLIDAQSSGGAGQDQAFDIAISEYDIYYAGYITSAPGGVHFDGIDITDLDGTQSFLGKFHAPAIIINVIEMKEGTEDAFYIELWSLEDNSSVIRKINDCKQAVFYPDEMTGWNITDLHLLRNDQSLIGKSSFFYYHKNGDADRQKEVIITLHNDLVPYNQHPIEDVNEKWAWKNYFKYDYLKPISASSTGIAITDIPFYPVTMLLPPVNEHASWSLKNINPDNKTLLLVHGWTDRDNCWGGHDTNIIPPEMLPSNSDFKLDYARTSTPSRLRSLSDATVDSWEFYYPPDQAWIESGFLLSRAIKIITEEYESDKLDLLAGFSMGGLVVGSYVSEVAKAYKPGLTDPQIVEFEDNVEKVLFLASPQECGALGNIAYFELAISESIATRMAGKDAFAPGTRDLSAGGLAIHELILSRQDPANRPGTGDGVEYLCLVGAHESSISKHAAKLLAPLNASKFHNDGAVAIHSGSLLQFGIDLGVLEHFEHTSFSGKFETQNSITDKDLLAKLIFDYMDNGELEQDNKDQLFLEYVEGNDPGNMQAVIREGGAFTREIRMDIANPILAFKQEDNSFWKPTLSAGQGFRFKLSTEEIASSGEHIAILSNDYVNKAFNLAGPLIFHSPGMYFNYSHNNFSEDTYKAGLETSSVFYAYEGKTLPKSNPLAIDTNMRILTYGGGWHLPVNAELSLPVYAAYKLPKKGIFGKLTFNKKVRYARLTDDGQFLDLRWSTSTYHEIVLSLEKIEVISCDQFLEKELPGSLNDDDFSSNAPVFADKAKGGFQGKSQADGLHNWIDCQTNGATFVLFYGENTTPPAMSLETPSGDIIDAADPDMGIYFTNVPDLSVSYFSVVSPEVGKWKVLLDGQNQLPDSTYNVSYPMNVDNSLFVHIDTSELVNDTSFLLTTKLENGLTGTDSLQVFSYCYPTDDENDQGTIMIEMFDDGTNLDKIANDGIFTGLFTRPDTSEYEFVSAMWGKLDDCKFIRQDMMTLPACDLTVDFAYETVEAQEEMSFENLSQAFESTRYVEWNFGDDSTSIEVHPTHIFAEDGEYEVSLKVVTATGCAKSITRTITVGGALPVELLHFKGQAEEKVNRLLWSTATEENSSHFVIERAVNTNINSFQEIGQLSATGNSFNVVNYQFDDMQPFPISYYRLRMVDLDGSSKYSPVIVIERKDEVEFAVLNVSPIPSTRTVNVEFSLNEDADIQLQLFDISGRLLLNQHFSGYEGGNSHSISIDGFPDGVYFIQLNDGRQQITKRILKN